MKLSEKEQSIKIKIRCNVIEFHRLKNTSDFFILKLSKRKIYNPQFSKKQS